MYSQIEVDALKRPNRVDDWTTIFKSPTLFLAFGFGSGLSPIMPGTAGTLVALPLYLLMASWHWSLYLLMLVLTSVLGFYLCGRAASKLNVHDHSGIVWDEFVGFWITMFLVPAHWYWVVLGFVLFRFFDIVKPWPISWVDRKVHGGVGIMLDDILAGLAAAGCLHIVVILTNL
ncbi:MAG: phosphatidylglycerophosphatase A [Alteromonadaceae bacterium]|nr:MAG: phosphatidylglycerophosphatase A [Alteromonadaceae bacterium]